MSFNVLAIGDSIIKAKVDSLRGWAKRFSEQYTHEKKVDLNYYNKGEGGDTSSDVLQRINAALEFENYWDIVIVGVGINDSRKRGVPPTRYEVAPELFKNNINEICNLLISADKVDRIIFSSVLPVIQEMTTPYKEDKYYFYDDALHYGDILENILKKYPKIKYFNFREHWQKLSSAKKREYMPDGLHPGPAGHRYLTNLALGMMRKTY